MSPYLILLEQMPTEDRAAGVEVFRRGGMEALRMWADILVDIEVARGDEPAAERARELVAACDGANEADAAFGSAIIAGRLSADESSPIYAGHYMFMGYNNDGRALFKHIDTREYLK